MQLTYAQAILATLKTAMANDEQVLLIGSSWLGQNPQRTKLWMEFSACCTDRLYYPPISEAAIVGTAIGAALGGFRPLVHLSTASFAFYAWPQIVNEAANVHYMSGGRCRVPAVFHMLGGSRGGMGPQHTHTPQAMFWNTPGLEIVLPSSPRDALGLLATAVASDNPTVFISHEQLMDEVQEEAPELPFHIPFGQAEIKRPGRDVTVVATSVMVRRALEAAAALAQQGIEAEVVDLRTLVPLDEATLLASVSKTRHVVVADECHLRCGVGAEIAAVVAEKAFSALRRPVCRVGTLDVPVPCSPPLERMVAPGAEKIVAAVRALLD